ALMISAERLPIIATSFVPNDAEGFCRSSVRPKGAHHVSIVLASLCCAAIPLFDGARGWGSWDPRFRSGGGGRLVGFAAHEHGPGDAGELVGDGDGGLLCRHALQQPGQP